MRRTYSQEEKAKALALCVEKGSYQASKQLGIPQGTLANWMVKADIASVAQQKMQKAQLARETRIAAKRAALRERLLEEAAYCAEAIHNEHIDFKSAGKEGPVKVVFPVAPAAAVQNYATALGILLDKFRLESGEVTSRDERHVIAQSEFDRKVQDLLADMDARAEGQVLQEPHGGRAGGDPVAVGGNGNGSGKVSQ